MTPVLRLDSGEPEYAAPRTPSVSDSCLWLGSAQCQTLDGQLLRLPGTARRHEGDPPLARHDPRHYGFAFGWTCNTMNPLPVSKYTRPPKPGVMSEPGVRGSKKSDSAMIRPVAASRQVTCSV